MLLMGLTTMLCFSVVPMTRQDAAPALVDFYRRVWVALPWRSQPLSIEDSQGIPNSENRLSKCTSMLASSSHMDCSCELGSYLQYFGQGLVGKRPAKALIDVIKRDPVGQAFENQRYGQSSAPDSQRSAQQLRISHYPAIILLRPRIKSMHLCQASIPCYWLSARAATLSMTDGQCLHSRGNSDPRPHSLKLRK